METKKIIILSFVFIIVMQNLIFPRFKHHFCIFILPIATMIFGITYILLSKQSSAHQLKNAIGLLLITILITISGIIEREKQCKKRQEKRSEVDFNVK